MSKDPNKYPPGLDAKKVKEIIAHHESQDDDEIIAKDEAAFGEGSTYVSVPKSLMPEIDALIAKHQTAS